MLSWATLRETCVFVSHSVTSRFSERLLTQERTRHKEKTNVSLMIKVPGGQNLAPTLAESNERRDRNQIDEDR